MCSRECSVWKGCCVKIKMIWYSLFRLYPIWHIYLSFLFCSGFMMVTMMIATSVVTNRQLCDQSLGIWSSTRPNTHQTLRSLHLVGSVHCNLPMVHFLWTTLWINFAHKRMKLKIKIYILAIWKLNWFSLWIIFIFGKIVKCQASFKEPLWTTDSFQRTMVMTMEMLKIPAMILWCQILQHQPSIDSLRAGLDLIKKKETLKDARRPDNPRRS